MAKKENMNKDKAAKNLKIPKFFKPKFRQNYFEKKIVKKLYIKSDIDYVKSLYTKGSDGFYTRKIDKAANKDEAKKMKALGIAVKKNQSFVIDITKVGLVVGVLAIVVLFNIVFKNMLVKFAIEAGLQSVFNAKAEVDNVDLDIIGLSITFDRLQVADEASPMKNLFDLGKTQIAMNSEQLLMGKIVVKNVECQNIRWNTDRNSWGGIKPMGSQVTTGGTNATSPAPAAGNDGKKKEEKPLFDMKNVDVNKVIDSNKTNLKSLTQISNANTRLVAMTNKWTSTVQESKKNVAEASKNMEEVKKLDIGAIKTPEQAKAAYDTINRAYPSVNNLINDVNKVSKDIGTDKASVDSQIGGMNGMIDRDYKFLLSALSLPKGGVMGIASSIIDTVLQAKLGKLYQYAMMAKTYSAKLQGGGAKDKKKKAPDPELHKRQGYTVPFPTTVYPAFLLQNLSSSVGKKGESTYFDGYVKDIASDADMWGKPITFHVGQNQGGSDLIVNGFADNRTKAPTSFGLELQANNYPFELKEGLGMLNANSVKGTYQFKTSLNLGKNDATTGNATIRLMNVDIDLVNKDDLIGKVVLESVKSVPAITIEVNYQIAPGGAITMNVKSNIDGIVGKKLSGIFGGMMKKYEKDVKDGLMKQLEPELKKNKTLSDAFNQVNNLQKGNLADANSYKAELDKKKKEIDDQVASFGKQATQQIEKQINLPKLPGF